MYIPHRLFAIGGQGIAGRLGCRGGAITSSSRVSSSSLSSCGCPIGSIGCLGGSSIGGHSIRTGSCFFRSGSCASLSSRRQLTILGLCQGLGLSAVKVEPPVADEVVLVEDGSIGAEEAVLGQTALTVSGADVEDLALSLGIGIVATINLSLAAEGSLGDLGQNGVVLTRGAGNVASQGSQGILTTCSC